MAWTTPNTAVAGNLIRATDYNTYIRDNFGYVFNSRPLAGVLRDNATDYTTTSATFVNVDGTNYTTTLTIASGRVLIGFTGLASNTGGAVLSTSFDVTIDGVRVGAAGVDGLLVIYGTGNGVAGAFTVVKTGLSVGSHVFTLQWHACPTTPGTSTLRAGNGSPSIDTLPSFWVLEI